MSTSGTKKALLVLAVGFALGVIALKLPGMFRPGGLFFQIQMKEMTDTELAIDWSMSGIINHKVKKHKIGLNGPIEGTIEPDPIFDYGEVKFTGTWVFPVSKCPDENTRKAFEEDMKANIKKLLAGLDYKESEITKLEVSASCKDNKMTVKISVAAD